MPKPVPIALGVVLSKDRVLLITRDKEPFMGMLGLPGGKIKPYENMSQAAVREIEEETGIKTEFDSGLGIISQQLKQGSLNIDNLLIHMCMLVPKSTKITKEGADWYPLKNLARIKKKMMPMDYAVLKKILPKPGGYYDCCIEKHDNEYHLAKFDKLS